MRRLMAILIAVLSITLLGYSLYLFDKSFRPDFQLRIGINPWPGYVFLYLAAQKGLFAQEGLNVRMVEFSSLQDVRQAFERGQIDAMCSTLVELIQAYNNSGRKLKIVLVTDYSNGGDVILARAPIKSLSDLKGAKVGVEPLSVGEVVLARALTKVGLKYDDVMPLQTAAMDMEKLMQKGTIDAAITYPPFSVSIEKHSNVSRIFDTSHIPNEIIDVLSIDESLLEKDPKIVPIIRRVWSRALSLAKNDEEEAYRIMSEREKISVGEFSEALETIHVLTIEEQKILFDPEGPLESDIAFTARVLSETGNNPLLIAPSELIFRSSAN